MEYKEEVIKAMELLAEDPRTIFIGQTVKYPSGPVYGTLLTVPNEKKIEVPVFEDTQLGICTGLSLMGLIPICIFPRFDFIICAMNQLVNHLDKIEEMSTERFRPKVIIRTMVGSTKPLYPGIQHSSNHTNGFRKLLKNIEVRKLVREEEIVPMYMEALDSMGSTILVELAQKGLAKP